MKAWRNVVSTVALLACTGLLIWRVLSSGGGEPYPDTEASTTAWMCAECRQMKHLTARERNEWTLSPDRVRRGEEATRLIPGAQQTVFRCEACQQFALVRARECPRHHEWYILRDPRGTPVGCEACVAEIGD